MLQKAHCKFSTDMIQTTASQFFVLAGIWLYKHRESWPKWLAFATLGAISLSVAGAYLTATHPAAGEIFTNQLISVFLLSVSIFAVALGFTIARNILDSGRDLVADLPREIGPIERALLACGVRLEYGPAALPASTWMPPSIHPDRLVCSLPGEEPAAFAARFESGVNAANAAAWTLVLQRGNPIGMVYGSPEQTLTFERDLPPFQTEDWPEDLKVVPRGTRFVGETEADFSAYVDRFIPHFREWSARRKLTADAHRAGFVFQQIVRASASVILVILCSLSAFSQKFEQVNRTPISSEVPARNTAVVFQFERSDLQRIADGKRTYSELLKAVPNYRDGGGGKLLSVWAGNEVVYQANEVERSVQPEIKSAAMRPYSRVVDPGQGGFQMPDSVTSAEMAERVKYEIWKAEQIASQTAKPWWSVVMAAFWVLYPILLILSVVSWVCARVFASEGMIVPHKYARRFLVGVLLSVGAVVLVNAMLWAISTGAGPIPLTVFGILLAAIAYYVVSRLTPNFSPAPGNEPERAMYNRNQPPLLR